MDESVNDITSITFEGRLIAKKIRALMEEKRQVMNKDGTFRSIDYSDIVILLRSIDKKAPALLKVLNEEHIPATADKDDDFIRSMEVQILWSLLKILDNPRQDLPLLAVLRSFLAGLDEEDFARLRLALAPEELFPKKKPSVFPIFFHFMKRGGKKHEKTASPPFSAGSLRTRTICHGWRDCLTAPPANPMSFPSMNWQRQETPLR